MLLSEWTRLLWVTPVSDMPNEDAVPSDTNAWDAQSQDNIILVQMASLSMDMFTPGDFKGKFRKIQPKKRPTIIREDTPGSVYCVLCTVAYPAILSSYWTLKQSSFEWSLDNWSSLHKSKYNSVAVEYIFMYLVNLLCNSLTCKI